MRNIKHSILGVVALAAWSFAGSTVPVEDQSRPNIFIFLSDDHGWVDSPQAGNEVIRMPHLQRMMDEGLSFQNAYAAASTCAPSRSSMFTGMYPVRHGAHHNHTQIHDGIKTWPVYFQEAGYRSILLGKTHFGPKEAFPFIKPVNKSWENVAKEMDDAKVDDKPFCIVYADDEPHYPHKGGLYKTDEVFVPPYMVDTPETRKMLSEYYSDITRMDEKIGRLRSMLEERGMDDNTIFIYTTDHGAPVLYGKWTLYDCGLHVPFVLHWPGKAEPGSKTDSLISLVDVLPTLLELAGASVPEDIDGRSFAKLLTDPVAKIRDFTYGVHSNARIIQGSVYPSRSVTDGRFNYIVNLNAEKGNFKNLFTSNKRPYYTAVWKSWIRRAKEDAFASERVRNYQQRPKVEFFDLQNDPWELSNHADNPEYAAQIKKMRRALDDWMVQQGDRGLETETAPATVIDYIRR